VLAPNSDRVWESAGGALLSWQALDFGMRNANVDVPRAEAAQTKYQAALTDLDVGAAATDANSASSPRTAAGAVRANPERLQGFAESVRALVRKVCVWRLKTLPAAVSAFAVQSERRRTASASHS
jgi:hypothetical protein